MAALHSEQIFRVEKVSAGLRIAVILLAGTEFLHAASDSFGQPLMIAMWGAALAYAGGVLLFEPYRRTALVVWDVASAFIDWGFITLAIIATGGERSPLYLLYFLAVLPRAARSRFGTAVDAGVGKAEAQPLAVNEVMATISHDLMNPLAAIGGLVDMLLDSAAERLSLDQQATLHRINANTQQMSHLVGNLLDVELIECGRQSFRPAPVDFNALVRRVVEAQAHQAEMKHIGLVLDLSDRLPDAMLDGRMIERLIANLLGNAVKFTPENGAVRVSTRQRGTRLAIEVWDSGPEPPAALQSVLFEKFIREKDSPGVGLGLYICKSIVDAHGGEIFVRKVADGVAFVAELPVLSAAPSATPRAETVAADTRSRHAWQSQGRVTVAVHSQ